MREYTFRTAVPILVKVTVDDATGKVDIESVNVMDEELPRADEWTQEDGSPLDDEAMEVARVTDGDTDNIDIVPIWPVWQTPRW